MRASGGRVANLTKVRAAAHVNIRETARQGGGTSIGSGPVAGYPCSRCACAGPMNPGPALALVDDLDLGGHHVFHAVRADLLRRLGRTAEAATAYEAAIASTGNTVERNFLRRRLRTLTL
jgi:hypothetical protein